jgi:hypothetical protein
MGACAGPGYQLRIRIAKQLQRETIEIAFRLMLRGVDFFMPEVLRPLPESLQAQSRLLPARDIRYANR